MKHSSVVVLGLDGRFEALNDCFPKQSITCIDFSYQQGVWIGLANSDDSKLNYSVLYRGFSRDSFEHVASLASNTLQISSGATFVLLRTGKQIWQLKS